MGKTVTMTVVMTLGLKIKKNMKYIISTIISVVVLVTIILMFGYNTQRPYEKLDDPAWECKVNGRTAHFLAENKEKQVLIDWGNNSRTWIDNSKLPHYYKLHNISSDVHALISSKTVEKRIVGKTMNEIEESLAFAGEYKGKTVSFPIKVLTKGEALSTESVKVTFEDSLATKVEYEQTVDSSALYYSYIPGMFLFINKGIKAPQHHSFTSHLKEDDEKTAQQRKKYHFGDLTVKIVSFLLKVFLFLLGAVLFLGAPFFVTLPLATFLLDHFYGDKTGWIIAILIQIVAFIFFSGALLVYFTLRLWPIVVVFLACTLLTAFGYGMIEDL